MDVRMKSGRNDKVCNCANCAQGKWTKEQYIREIRALSSRFKPRELMLHSRNQTYQNGRLERRSSLSYKSWRSSSSDEKQMNLNLDWDSKVRNSRKISEKSGNFSYSNGNRFVNHLTWVEQTAGSSIAKNNLDMIYYIDEEQPSDIEAFSEMVNGTSTDSRILTAMVETIRYLRQGYHQMLLDMKPKSIDFFNREFAKLERDRFYTNERDRKRNSSPDESDSGTTDLSDRRNHTVRMTNESPKCHKNETINQDSDWSHSRSDSGVTLLSNGHDNPSRQAISNSALHTAALEGDTNKVMYLTLRGCDVNHCSNEGWPAVDFALRKCKFRCAIFLVEAGTNMMNYTAKKIQEYTEVIYRGRRYLQFMQTSL